MRQGAGHQNTILETSTQCWMKQHGVSSISAVCGGKGSGVFTCIYKYISTPNKARNTLSTWLHLLQT